MLLSFLETMRSTQLNHRAADAERPWPNKEWNCTWVTGPLVIPSQLPVPPVMDG